METVGERIKRLRKDLKLTQADLAMKLDIEPPAVSKYETDRVPIPIEQLTKLANIFNVTTDYILCRTDNPTIDIQFNPDEKHALAIHGGITTDISDLDEDAQDDIIKYIELVKLREANKKKE